MYSYALVNRPVGIGAIPRGLQFSVSPRPEKGQPHHDMARHGILLTERQLTTDELRSFELAPLAEGEVLEALSDAIAVDMSEYAQGYLEEFEAGPRDFEATVNARATSTVNGVRYSIGDQEALVQLVVAKLHSHLGLNTSSLVPSMHEC